MDAGEIVAIVLFVLIAGVIGWRACDIVHDTTYTYWDGGKVAIDEGVDDLVDGVVDSLTVTYYKEPGIKGWIYFKTNE